jgi:hypothetical protein
MHRTSQLKIVKSKEKVVAVSSNSDESATTHVDGLEIAILESQSRHLASRMGQFRSLCLNEIVRLCRRFHSDQNRPKVGFYFWAPGYGAATWFIRARMMPVRFIR